MKIYLAIDMSGSMQEGAKQFVVLSMLQGFLYEVQMGLTPWTLDEIHILYVSDAIEDYTLDDSCEIPMPSGSFKGKGLNKTILLDYITKRIFNAQSLFFFFTDRPLNNVKFPSFFHTILVGDEYPLDSLTDDTILSPESFVSFLHCELEKTGVTS